MIDHPTKDDLKLQTADNIQSARVLIELLSICSRIIPLVEFPENLIKNMILDVGPGRDASTTMMIRFEATTKVPFFLL
jgi:hypothetical protein